MKVQESELKWIGKKTSLEISNPEIREALAKKGIPQWKFGALCGVSEQTIYRWLRAELPPERKKELLKVINDYEVR